MRLVQICEEMWVNPKHVVAVMAVKVNATHCTKLTTVDGGQITLTIPVETVLERLECDLVGL